MSTPVVGESHPSRNRVVPDRSAKVKSLTCGGMDVGLCDHRVTVGYPLRVSRAFPLFFLFSPSIIITLCIVVLCGCRLPPESVFQLSARVIVISGVHVVIRRND